MTVATTVFNPPADRFTCTFAVTRIDALVERPENIYWARCCTDRTKQYWLSVVRSAAPIYSGQPTPEPYPVQWRLPVAFPLRQLHALRNRLTINHRGTTAYSPDPASVFVRCEAVSLFLIEELIGVTDARAPASTKPRTAALNLVLLVAIITVLFSTIVFDFEIQVGQIFQ